MKEHLGYENKSTETRLGLYHQTPLSYNNHT